MKKIGIVTLYRDNFGSILQAYSTYFFVNSLGNDCSLLQVKYSKNYMKKIKKIPIILYKCLRYKSYFADQYRLKKISKKEINLLSKNTRNMMDNFVDSTFKIEECDIKNLKLLNSKYDYFITGSDQVWNGYDKFKYLVFADKEKRIALAPSFGTSSIKEYFKKNIKKALKGFNVLSAREESGVQIINVLTGKNAERLSDPTILLTKSEWIKFSSNGVSKTNYILIHFLNRPNELAIQMINRYLKNHECVALCICNNYKEYDQLIRFEFIDISPYDYVSLLASASFVFTDSFHSTLFSLNLETQFLTFERQYLHGISQNSRIMDLLNRVKMTNRFVTGNDPIEFNKLELWDSNALFKNEREKIKRYIQEVLGR